MYFFLPDASPVSVDAWLKVKHKARSRTGQEGPDGEKRYSSTLSLTLAPDGGAWSTTHPSSFTLGMNQYPLYRRLGGPQGRCGKSHPPMGFDPGLSSPASRYTNYAIPAHVDA
jgi:hypothetical protein